MLYLDGAYDSAGGFWPVKPPIRAELEVITHTIATRVARDLENAGYLVRDPEHEYLDLAPDDDDAINHMAGASTDPSDRSYRLAFGPNAGRKVLMLQTVPAREQKIEPNQLVSRQG